MHKKETLLIHNKIANELLNYITNNIQSDINIDNLALDFNISKVHLHKIFKEQMGTAIYETIKSIRLQKASNILITNKHSTITQVANMCGYSSQTSFIRAFKHRFKQTPKIWRNGAYKQYSNKILSSNNIDLLTSKDFSNLEANIIKVKQREAFYIRQKSYNKNIHNTWLKLQAWIYSNKLENYEQIAIYHDNPIITPASDCHYVACVVPHDTKKLINTNLPSFDIQECVCLTFDFEGYQSDILKLIQWVYHEYLPKNGFETITIPSYMIFKQNTYINTNEVLYGTYHVPISYL